MNIRRGEFCLIAQWTAEVIAKMHMESISQSELAKKMGYSCQWVSMVLNGKRSPEGAEIKFRAALDELIQEKEEIAREA